MMVYPSQLAILKVGEKNQFPLAYVIRSLTTGPDIARRTSTDLRC